MTRARRTRIQKNDVLTWVGYILPVLGGLLGVAFVNVNHMEFINPVWAVGGGAILGWIVARLIRRILG
ncbi:hypothetical protein [Ruegeria sp. 6PALISEP08]|uniref:hypothetical protein n=1 Tax=Ruegeria sp. 6PALISEP08 TaxID=1225660 RepID=UPI00067EEE67|nr:hypothetical protein [Ruegeria sp. 6PALISEP08]